MMTRFASAHRGRAVLIRRLEALEKRREQQPAQAPVLLNLGLLTSDLLEKLVSVAEWMEAHGEDALQDDHRAILSEFGEFYESLAEQGVDIYDHPSKAAA
jgi:hypothetical protein